MCSCGSSRGFSCGGGAGCCRPKPVLASTQSAAVGTPDEGIVPEGGVLLAPYLLFTVQCDAVVNVTYAGTIGILPFDDPEFNPALGTFAYYIRLCPAANPSAQVGVPADALNYQRVFLSSDTVPLIPITAFTSVTLTPGIWKAQLYVLQEDGSDFAAITAHGIMYASTTRVS